MARRIRSAQLESRTARLKLGIRRKVYAVRIAPGVRLGYRRNETTGSWSVMVANGQGGSWMKVFGLADDHQDADNELILNYWQAQDRARLIACGEAAELLDGIANKLITVSAALTAYEADLETRGADVANVARVRVHLPPGLGMKSVALLTVRELRRWRDGLRKALAASSVNRVCNAFRAALNLAADTDERIASRRAWEVGLQAIPDAAEARNVILPTEMVRRIVTEAYGLGHEFGLLIEMAAATGARISQIARLQAQDLQGGRADSRLQMPSSRKGRGQKKIIRRPVPITEAFAVRLRHAAKEKSPTAFLLTKPGGEPWKKSDHTRPFRRAVGLAGLDPTEVTVYSLRHSSVVRQLLEGVPIRVVAVNHDSSVAILERTYSKFIADHADAVARKALVDFSTPPEGDKVVPLSRR